MTIVRWRHNHPTTSLSDGIERFFNDSLLGAWEDQFAGRAWNPAVDVSEDEAGFLVKAELPGMAKEDVEVEIHDSVLTIKGEKKEEKEEKDKRYYRVERRYGSFERSFYLPDNVDLDGIKASHRNGVLELRIPKVIEQKPEPKKIEIASD